MKNGNYILVLAPQSFPGKKYRNRYCLEHHLVYWQHFNVVPKNDEVIHHKNGDRFDNRIENLELISKKEHSSLHKKLNGRLYVDIKCPNCGTIFSIPYNQCFKQKGSSYTCCSRNCGGSFSNKIKNLKNFNADSTIIKKYKKKLEL